MLVLAPVMCILSGIGVSQVLTTYMKNLDVSRLDKKSKKQQDSTYPIKNEVTTWPRSQLKPGYLGMYHAKISNRRTHSSFDPVADCFYHHFSSMPASVIFFFFPKLFPPLR